jgi:SAM-dependent methyltransferase
MQFKIVRSLATVSGNLWHNLTFNHFYASIYDELHREKDYALEFEGLEEILKNLNYSLGGKKILEIGCGTGNFTAFLGLSNQVTAVDKSEEMLTIARSKLNSSKITFCNLPLNKIMQNSEDKFDVILLWFNVFGYLTRSEVKELVKICSSRLKPKGLLIFDYWDRAGVSRNPARETKKVFGLTSEYLRVIRPLFKISLTQYSVFFLLVRFFALKSDASPQLLNLELHKVRFYKSSQLNQVFRQLEVCGNWSLNTRQVYNENFYSNLKIYRSPR